MTRKISRSLLILVVALLLGPVTAPSFFGAYAQAPTSTEILPLSQVRTGMQGYAYTIFAGDQVEKFDLEVIGIMPNFLGPRQTIILVQLKGPKVEHTGVVAGMGALLPVDAGVGRTPVVGQERRRRHREVPSGQTGEGQAARGQGRRRRELVGQAEIDMLVDREQLAVANRSIADDHDPPRRGAELDEPRFQRLGRDRLGPVVAHVPGVRRIGGPPKS